MDIVMLIYKEELPIATADIRQISLPCRTIEEAKRFILKVDVQYNFPCMWYQADPCTDCEKFNIVAIGTGHHIESKLLSPESYIGTCILDGGDLVLHYFIVKKFKPNEKDIVFA